MVTGGMVKNTHADVDRLLHQRDLIDQVKGPGIAMADPGGQQAWDKYGANPHIRRVLVKPVTV
jgi:hypothetical protein